MKIRNLFFASLAALTFAACSNDDAPAPKAGSIVVNLSSVSAETKADQDLASLEAERTISTGEVYVFDAAGQIVTKQSLSNGSATIAGTYLAVGTTYTFAGVANHTTDATSLEALKQEVVQLGEAKSNFVMLGTISKEIGETVESIEIPVSRVLSAVQLLSIKSAFKEGTPDYAMFGTATVKGLYLSTTNPTAQLDGTPISGAGIESIKADLNTVFDKNLVNIEPSVEARAYACPGKAKYAVLTVEYSYRGATQIRYYNIANKITEPAANTLYGLNVTLTGPGSGDKENPDEFGSAVVTMRVVNWKDGSVIDVEDQEN